MSGKQSWNKMKVKYVFGVFKKFKQDDNILISCCLPDIFVPHVFKWD